MNDMQPIKDFLNDFMLKCENTEFPIARIFHGIQAHAAEFIHLTLSKCDSLAIENNNQLSMFLLHKAMKITLQSMIVDIDTLMTQIEELKTTMESHDK